MAYTSIEFYTNIEFHTNIEFYTNIAFYTDIAFTNIAFYTNSICFSHNVRDYAATGLRGYGAGVRGPPPISHPVSPNPNPGPNSNPNPNQEPPWSLRRSGTCGLLRNGSVLSLT